MNTTEQKVQKVNTSEVRFIIAMRKTTVVEKTKGSRATGKQL